jgi:trimeric autotransporter adhesin
MNARSAQLCRIVLFTALILITACTGTSNPSAHMAGGGGPCNTREDFCNVLQGYEGNLISSGIRGATISGGGVKGSHNQVTGNYGTVSGGKGNLAGEGSTVAGGDGNTALYFHASVGGGTNNQAVAEEATVAGGLGNTASERFATVSGGASNTASDLNATVGGGSGNSANHRFSTVAGGTQNQAGSVAAVISGGDHNLAQGADSSILGGVNNTADGFAAAVGGGAGNGASGSYAVVPGGFSNLAAGDFSFAAGRNARVSAAHPGSFLFADSNRFPFPSLAPNEFAVRATGGVRFTTGIDGSGSPLAGVRLSPGSGTWESLSDVNAKAGFAAVDGRRILNRLMTVPVSSWYYRSQGASIRHIGPTAQDFYAAFAVGQDAHYISSVDEEGVALAAVQELYRIVQQLPAQCSAPSLQNPGQQAQFASLERRITFSNGLAAVSVVIAVLALWKRKK